MYAYFRHIRNARTKTAMNKMQLVHTRLLLLVRTSHRSPLHPPVRRHLQVPLHEVLERGVPLPPLARRTDRDRGRARFRARVRPLTAHRQLERAVRRRAPARSSRGRSSRGSSTRCRSSSSSSSSRDGVAARQLPQLVLQKQCRAYSLDSRYKTINTVGGEKVLTLLEQARRLSLAA